MTLVPHVNRWLCCLLLSVMINGVRPAVDDREPLLKAKLTEALVLVNQSRAIQQLATKLGAEFGREYNWAIFGQQARTAARGIVSVLCADRGCITWDPSVKRAMDDGPSSCMWVTSSAEVKARLKGARKSVPADSDVVIVIENMDRIDCSNILYLNNLMSAMERNDGGTKPTFLFLFENDLSPDAYSEGGSIRSYWAEHYEAKCHPGPALNLKAFFGRLTPVTLESVPSGIQRDTQAVCTGLARPWMGLGWPFGNEALGDNAFGNKALAIAVGLIVVASTTFAVARARSWSNNVRGPEDDGTKKVVAAAASKVRGGAVRGDVTAAEDRRKSTRLSENTGAEGSKERRRSSPPPTSNSVSRARETRRGGSRKAN